MFLPRKYSFCRIFIVFALLSLIIETNGHGNDGHNHDQSNDIVGQKSDRGLTVVSNNNDHQPHNYKPMECSICSSISPDGLTPNQRQEINPVGQECINSPEKFIRDCDEWRNSLLVEHGSINRTVHFTGCYKTIYYYEHDDLGEPIKETRVVRKCGFMGKPGCGRVTGKHNQYNCFCKENGCNTGAHERSSFYIVLIVTLLAICLR